MRYLRQHSGHIPPHHLHPQARVTTAAVRPADSASDNTHQANSSCSCRRAAQELLTACRLLIHHYSRSPRPPRPRPLKRHQGEKCPSTSILCDCDCVGSTFPTSTPAPIPSQTLQYHLFPPVFSQLPHICFLFSFA
jgi:hypothetical protein